MKFSAARARIKTLVEAIPQLAGVGVFLERGGEDLEAPVADAVRAKGLAIVILSAAGATVDQSRGGVVSLSATVALGVLENPATNFQPGGAQLSSEDVVELLIANLAGKDVGSGGLSIGDAAFARADEEDGLLLHVLIAEVPLVIRPGT